MLWLPRFLRKGASRPRLVTAATLGFYAEAQFAGWVPAPSALLASAVPTEAPVENADPEGLLGRFYESQEC